jgi:hypothetical protein
MFSADGVMRRKAKASAMSVAQPARSATWGGKKRSKRSLAWASTGGALGTAGAGALGGKGGIAGGSVATGGLVGRDRGRSP